MSCFNSTGRLVQSGQAGSRWVFSSKQTEIFRQMAQEARELAVSSGRSKLPADSSSVVAVFSGSSGTGKTMAAEMIARELRTNLYRVSLNNVVSKYIGETEKNLARVFEIAQNKSAVLLFDEADALFGKRSEVKDRHGRYANREVSYLLAKREAYRGLVIFASNRKADLDTKMACGVKYLLEFAPPIPSPRVQSRR